MLPAKWWRSTSFLVQFSQSRPCLHVWRCSHIYGLAVDGNLSVRVQRVPNGGRWHDGQGGSDGLGNEAKRFTFRTVYHFRPGSFRYFVSSHFARSSPANYPVISTGRIELWCHNHACGAGNDVKVILDVQPTIPGQYTKLEQGTIQRNPSMPSYHISWNILIINLNTA